MSELPNTFEALIDQWGIAQFADAIGVSYSTANAMKQRNSVPHRYWKAVIAKAPGAFQLNAGRMMDLAERAGKVAA